MCWITENKPGSILQLLALEIGGRLPDPRIIDMGKTIVLVSGSLMVSISLSIIKLKLKGVIHDQIVIGCPNFVDPDISIDEFVNLVVARSDSVLEAHRQWL